MKVVHLVEGHNFHVDWHFKFWVEICEKLDGLAVPPVFRNPPAFNVLTSISVSGPPTNYCNHYLLNP
jgi:hypothetical protein